MVSLRKRNEARQNVADFGERKEIVKRVIGGNNVRHHHGIEIYDQHFRERVGTSLLAEADYSAKKGEYSVSLDKLRQAEKYLEKITSNEIPIENHPSTTWWQKYASSIQGRAYRLSNKLKDNPYLDRDAIKLVEKMEKDYGVHPHSALEKTVATTALVGLLGAAFFLSSKVTGNVIGMSTQTSSIVGAVFLIIGLTAGFFWLRKKKENKVIQKKKASLKSKKK